LDWRKKFTMNRGYYSRKVVIELIAKMGAFDFKPKYADARLLLLGKLEK